MCFESVIPMRTLLNRKIHMFAVYSVLAASTLVCRVAILCTFPHSRFKAVSKAILLNSHILQNLATSKVLSLNILKIFRVKRRVRLVRHTLMSGRG
jgi:hypothetical protein